MLINHDASALGSAMATIVLLRVLFRGLARNVNWAKASARVFKTPRRS